MWKRNQVYQDSGQCKAINLKKNIHLMIDTVSEKDPQNLKNRKKSRIEDTDVTLCRSESSIS